MSILECLPSILINGKRLFDLSFIIKKNAIQKQKEETNNQCMSQLILLDSPF